MEWNLIYNSEKKEIKTADIWKVKNIYSMAMQLYNDECTLFVGHI